MEFGALQTKNHLQSQNTIFIKSFILWRKLPIETVRYVNFPIIFCNPLSFDLGFNLMDMRKVVELPFRDEELDSENQQVSIDISAPITFEETIVNTVIIETQDITEDVEKYCRDTQPVKIVGIPVGFISLKHLTLKCSLSFEQLLWILAKCKLLESLTLSCIYFNHSHKHCNIFNFIDDTTNCDAEHNQQQQQEAFEKFQDCCFFIPIMESMKSLSVMGAFEDDTKERFVLDFVKCCPNLQELKYAFTGFLDDKFFACLSKMCSKLKRIELESYSELKCIARDDTFYQFLKSQPFLEYLDVFPCSGIPGEL